MSIFSGRDYKIPALAIFLIVASIGSVHAPAGYGWAAKAPMPTARFQLATVAVGNYVYALGGGGTAQQAYDLNERYEPSTDKWTRLHPMPIARVNFAAASLNGKVYVAGGIGASGNYLNSLEEYDPATDSWAEKTPMSVPRAGLALVSSSANLYAIGGHYVIGPFRNDSLAVVEQYAPASDNWANQTSAPVGFNTVSAVTIGTDVYAIGGVQPTMSVYHPSSKTWTQLPSLNTTTERVFVYSAAALAPNTGIYMVGRVESLTTIGYNGNATMEYDTVNGNRTDRTANPFTSQGSALVGLNGAIFALGGMGPPPGLQAMNNNEAYGPATNNPTTPPAPISVQILLALATAVIITTVVLGIWIHRRRARVRRKRAMSG